MKKYIAVLLCLVMAVLCACEVSIEHTDSNGDGLSATRVTEYEFYAPDEYVKHGFKSANEEGIITDPGNVTTDGIVTTKRFFVGLEKKTGFYVDTAVEHKASQAELGVYNRGYDIYRKNGEYEFGFLHQTDMLCYYKILSPLYSEGRQHDKNDAKIVADDFLYNVMHTGWKNEYGSGSVVEGEDSFIIKYTRVIEGVDTDDVLVVEVDRYGRVLKFEGYGRQKYDVLESTVTADMLKNAESALLEYANECFGSAEAYEKTIVTDNKGELYLKLRIACTKGVDTAVYVKLSADKLQMTEEYKKLIESNYQNNKKLDEDNKTTTRNKLINDQNGETIAKFMYGNYNASYNSCGAIAVHNAKVLLGLKSTLSETIYDIQNTAGLSLGGAFGSNAETVPEIMKKYGIKCTEVTVSTMGVNGVYIVSFWHENPPWNGTHTVAVSYNGRSHIAYNLTGDGNTSVEIFSNYGDRIISVYKVG